MSNGIKVLLGVVGGALLVLVLLAVFAGSGLFGSGPVMGSGGMMGQGGMMGGWGVFGIVWMMLVPLLFLGGLVAVIVWAVTQLASGRHDASSAGAHEQSAEEILRQRFARGEIDAEEYEERRRILNEQHRREEGPK